MDSVDHPGYIYHGMIGMFGLYELSGVDRDGTVTAVITNGRTLEKWTFKEKDTVRIGNMLYLSKPPRRTELKGSRK